MITLGGAPGSGRAAVAGTGPGAGASLASGSVRPGTHRCYGFRRLHESRISIRGAPFGAGTRSVDTQSGLLPEGWLRFDAPFGRACVPAVGPRERPPSEGLQEVTVVTEKGKVAGKPRIEPQAGLPPIAPIGVGLGDAGSWHDAV